jgi:hypothetical protein
MNEIGKHILLLGLGYLSLYSQDIWIVLQEEYNASHSQTLSNSSQTDLNPPYLTVSI